MEKKESLKKIQSYQFAVYDLLLYLDTHPRDKKAFRMYQDLTNKLRILKKEYQEDCRPLNIDSVADFDRFRWINDPWPWEKEANV